MRLLLPLPDSGGVLCATGDGALLTLGSKAAALVARSALPGTPAATAPAAATAGGQLAATAALAKPGAAAEADEEAPEGTTAGPEFVAEAGYRGHRHVWQYKASLC